MLLFFIISAVLLFAQGVCKGICDTLQFHYAVSIFAGKNAQYWNPAISWKNKYKGGDPTRGEKFIGSTTVFVMFTDGWHLFDFLRIVCSISALLAIARTGFAPNLLEVGIFLASALIIHATGFYLMYRYVLKRK